MLRRSPAHRVDWSLSDIGLAEVTSVVMQETAAGWSTVSSQQGLQRCWRRSSFGNRFERSPMRTGSAASLAHVHNKQDYREETELLQSSTWAPRAVSWCMVNFQVGPSAKKQDHYELTQAHSDY